VDSGVDFEQLITKALDGIPADLRERIANVGFIVEDEPPPGSRWLGVYQGLPLTQRAGRTWLYPDRITIFRGPIERIAAGDPERLAREVEHVVRHEVAHYFGISDQRLVEIDRY
jgi:predicted Zn-dependent protease with MMP-like domain